ncbi:hypothetical protein [Enterovibrio nigricans]|uniref:Uncharacterized protein n=1 Tax=Enterovibrio nigricans DSM 22720 TaxID=1121868 RepID=A0A1T4V0S4_9GAMM|nr:hypothetical protein [Enterovibrio nigricans]SKA58497.1 hypothetical protein SAMN02745132_02979 [Enterovibrio nigricans DSM 22720]
MSNQLISIDIFYVLERLLPGKRTVELFRKNTKHLPVTTLTLEHCDSASALQLALYKHCKNYASFSQGQPLSDDYAIDGKDDEIQPATNIIAAFIRGSYWWVEHYLEIYREDWSEDQKAQWLKDLKLLVRVIIGIGNARKAEWIIRNHGAIKALTFNTHITPFLQHYD